MKTIYLFNWPSHLGGADTKVAHLIKLLGKHVPLVVIPNSPACLKQRHWIDFIEHHGAKVSSLHDLAQDPNGIAFSMCNPAFVKGGLFNYAIKFDWPIIWSSEMMWRHEFEEHLIETGRVKKLLYVSECQKEALAYEADYDVPTLITGNYVDPAAFPFKERIPEKKITIGRLSRHDPLKYPEDFPVFYEALKVRGARYRVMAWNEELAEKYRWHSFGPAWDLLKAEEETAVNFLQSLDLFVYPLGHQFTESWGRSTVEAMLTGAIPLVPGGHHFGHLIQDGDSGFICEDFRDYQIHARRLACDHDFRMKMSKQCHEHARYQLCDQEHHRQIWLEALDV